MPSMSLSLLLEWVSLWINPSSSITNNSTGCRLPGGIKSPDDLWKLLIEEQSGRCDVPPSRWNIEGFYHPSGQRPGSMNTKGGYFIQDDIRQFDNSFFGINNLEATYMDPQQRKLLEVCYECFESAGATLEDIDGANIGCYVGNFTIDYITMQAKDAEYFHRYHATGMGTTILSNRISHVFNLTGPRYVLHLACLHSILTWSVWFLTPHARRLYTQSTWPAQLSTPANVTLQSQPGQISFNPQNNI